MQTADNLLRPLQYKVAVLGFASVALNAAALNEGSEGMFAVHSAAHWINEHRNSLDVTSWDSLKSEAGS